jgi:hypothetical protein
LFVGSENEMLISNEMKVFVDEWIGTQFQVVKSSVNSGTALQITGELVLCPPGIHSLPLSLTHTRAHTLSHSLTYSFTKFILKVRNKK